MENSDPKVYPIGKVQYRDFTKEVLYQSILMIEAAPYKLRERLSLLKENEWDLSYREGGWTIRQIVHHLADSHMNMWIRVKNTLLLDNHTIMPYDQNAWANSGDYQTADPESSLLIFEGIQQRFSNILKTMSEEDFKRTYYHPEYKKTYSLAEVTQLYAWHGFHHTAQIETIFK